MSDSLPLVRVLVSKYPVLYQKSNSDNFDDAEEVGESGKRKVGRRLERDGKNRGSVLSTFGCRNHFRIQFVVADIFS